MKSTARDSVRRSSRIALSFSFDDDSDLAAEFLVALFTTFV